MTQHRNLPPDHDRDFHQLTGAFDQPVAPSPAFAERLKQRFAETPHEKGAPTMHAAQAAPPRATRMTAGRVIPLPDQGNRLVRILEATAAAVLILVLVGGGFFLNRDSNGPGDDPIRLAAVTGTTTPEPDATPAPTVSAWTDPGHTNAYPAGFDPDTVQPAERLGNLDFKSAFGLVSGNTLVLIGMAPEEDSRDIPGIPTIMGLDLQTETEKWSTDSSISALPVAGDGVLAAVAFNGDSDDSVGFELFALSLETGELLWTQPVASFPASAGLDVVSPLRGLPVGSPIIVDGTIYIAKTSGAVSAFDAKTGSVLWQTDGWDDQRNPDHIGGSLVGDDSDLYIVDGENAIRKIDRKNGEMVDTFAENVRPAPNFLLDLHLQGGRLIMIARDPQTRPSDTLVDVLSTDTGDMLWSTKVRSRIDFGYPLGGLALTNEILAIPEAVAEVQTPSATEFSTDIHVRVFDLETGMEIATVDAPLWSEASVSASGPVICIHGTSPQLSCFDTTDPDSDPQTIDIGAAYVAEGPPSTILFWNDSAIVLGHDGGPYIIRSGSATPEASATPAASPVTTSESSAVQRDARDALLTNDPGHTSAYPAGYDPAQTGAPAKLEALRVSPGTSVIAGDTLIVSGRDEETWRKDPAIVMATQAIDLGTGQELWYSDTGLFGTLVVDDWNVYGYQSDPDYQRSSHDLVSLSLETGALNWKIQPLTPAPNGTLTPPTDLLMIGTHLYVPFPNGSVTAYSQLGQVEWTHETGLATKGFFENWHPVAGDENALYVAGQDGQITKLDRLTGEVLDTFTTEVEPGNVDAMDLYVRAGTLVAVVHPPGGPERIPETVVVMAADSGEIRWTHEVDYVAGNLVLTDTLVGVPEFALTAESESKTSIVFHDALSGDVLATKAFLSTTTPSLSASGDVICLYTIRVECGTVESLERVVTGVAFPNAFGVNPPIMFWNDQLVIVNSETGVYVTAPPESTRGAFQPDYRATGDLTVNLRWGPGIRYDVAATVSPDEPLQSLDASEPTRHPGEDTLADGQEWLKVRTRSGNEGWVRDVDINEHAP